MLARSAFNDKRGNKFKQNLRKAKMFPRASYNLAISSILIITTVLQTSNSRTQSSAHLMYEDKDLNILDELLQSYDRRVTPTHHMGLPTTVECELYLRSIGAINPATMDYEVDLYLRQTWHDERLRSNNLTRHLDLNDPVLVKRLWRPDVYFPNAKHGEFQYVTVPNVLLRINTNGDILYMLRLKLTFSCMMEMERYPLDTQVCDIELASFSKTVREVELQWLNEKSVSMYNGLKLAQFELRQVSLAVCKETFQIGEYSCLQARLDLKRSIGHYLVQYYLPSTLIVFISWVSFWLDVDAIPARITLGVTTLLTISSESSDQQSNLAPVSYVKALDVWMGTCTFFVFAALIEFTFVSYLARKRGKIQKFKSEDGEVRATLIVPIMIFWITLNLIYLFRPFLENISFLFGWMQYFGKMNILLDKNNMLITYRPNCIIAMVSSMQDVMNIREVSSLKPLPARGCAKRIDKISRIVFPFGFLIFNVFYWPYYLY